MERKGLKKNGNMPRFPLRALSKQQKPSGLADYCLKAFQ